MTSGSKVSKTGDVPPREDSALTEPAHQVLLNLVGDATSVNGTCIYPIAPFRLDRPLIRSSFLRA